MSNTTREQLQQAANLIKAKNYKQARTLLETIDHPKAKEWLAKLNQRRRPSPPSETRNTRPKARPNPRGKVIGEFGIFQIVLVSRVVVALIVIGICVWATLFTEQQGDFGTNVILPLLFTALFLFFALRPLIAKMRGRTTTIYENSIARNNTFYAWEKIDALTQLVLERFTLASIPIFVVGSGSLRDKDNEVLFEVTVFDDQYMKQLNIINQAIIRTQLPEAKQRLQNGETVAFGDATVNPDGVCKDSDELVLWQDITHAELRDSFVVVHYEDREKDKNRRMRFEASNLKNPPVFVELINSAVNK